MASSSRNWKGCWASTERRIEPGSRTAENHAQIWEAEERPEGDNCVARIGIFKKDQPLDREPTLRDPDQILAYLEELCRLGSEVAMKLEEEAELAFAAQVTGVDEDSQKFTLRLRNLPGRDLKPGVLVYFLFTLDGLRFRTQARFLARGGYMESEFALPEAILHGERRNQVRARFSAQEPAKAIALEAVSGGLGISGPIINLNMGGICLRVERLIDVRKGRRIQARSELFAAISSLAFIRLIDLPLIPNLVCSGTLRHVNARGDGLFLGIQLEGLGPQEIQELTQVMVHKVPGFGAGFPRKRRQNSLAPGRPEPEPPEPEVPPPPPEFEQALEDAEIQDLRGILELPNRLALLRRRSRQVLLVASDELKRAVLSGTLYVDGYRNIHEANCLVQALEQARRHALDVVLVDQQVGPHSALEIIQQLRSAGRLQSAKVIVLKSREEVKLKVAEKAGGIDFSVTQPVDFEGILKPELERLLGIN